MTSTIWRRLWNLRGGDSGRGQKKQIGDSCPSRPRGYVPGMNLFLSILFFAPLTDAGAMAAETVATEASSAELQTEIRVADRLALSRTHFRIQTG